MSDDFNVKYAQPYEERLAEWQAKEDAKSLEYRLYESRLRAYDAVDDYILGTRNAPDLTLQQEITRGRALQGLLHCRDNPATLFGPQLVSTYTKLLDSVPPVEPPVKNLEDYAKDSAAQMAEAVDRAILGRVEESL